MAPEWNYSGTIRLCEGVARYIFVQRVSANCFAFPGHEVEPQTSSGYQNNSELL